MKARTWLSIVYSIAIAAAVIIFLTRCASSRIVDASPATLINAEKVKHSTNALVCVQDKEGRRYSFYYNTSCWRCKTVNVPANWNVVIMRNGKAFIEPVK